MRSSRTVVMALGLLAVLPVRAEPADADALSPRNASYTLEVVLDPEARTLRGTGTLHWRNLQSEPTDRLPFHLYWNAWRNDASTWMRQNRTSPRRGRSAKRTEDDAGSIDVEGMRLVDAAGATTADLLRSARFEAPDDGNLDDRTVLVVDLPRPVAPGETIAVAFEWHARIPRTVARTGFRGDFFFVAHWFPKLGVYEPGGWNCHQFHATTEFYSDYGVYDVTITVPERFVVGATGRLVETREGEDGTVSHRYVQEDVHAFTWTASPDFVVREARFEHDGLPPVDLRLLVQPEHVGQAERHFEATRATLALYGTWYGPYPYGQLTIVDPAYGSGAGGMEYPTLFTAGTRLFAPSGGGSPEGVTIHEAGHQFWYGLVGNNEFEHAWLDEGLNTFSTARVYAEAFGERRFVARYLDLPGTDLGGFFPVLFDDIRLSRAVNGNRIGRYLASGAEYADAQATPTYRYDPPTAARISYDKTAIWLATLERHLGWETVQRILQTFFERYRFAHPRPDDFFAVANEVAGVDLTPFFDAVHRGTSRFAYAVDRVSSEPSGIEGWIDTADGPTWVEREDPADLYRSEVVVRRLGDGIFPVDVLLVFDDGTEVRRAWDGADRFLRIVEERPARLTYAVVDPERVLLLDLVHTDNSRVRDPDARLPVAKWASKWMVWLQDRLDRMSFFF